MYQYLIIEFEWAFGLNYDHFFWCYFRVDVNLLIEINF